MDLTIADLDDAFDLWDLTETVTHRSFNVAIDTAGGATPVTVLALKRVEDDREEPAGDDGSVFVKRRRWHLRKLTLDAAGVTTVKPRDLITSASGDWVVVSVEVAAHGTRYVCECIRSVS